MNIRNISPLIITLWVALMATGGFSYTAQAEEHSNNERSRWDVKSFPRLPSAEKIDAEIEGFVAPHRPEEGKALVYVVRPGWLLGLVRYGVYIDGRDTSDKVGHNRTRQYIHFNLEPGEHTISSKASNWADIRVTVKAGETIFIEQESNAFVTNSLFQLSEDEGKYRIKRTKPGTVLRTDA
jgi:hypothetical protein